MAEKIIIIEEVLREVGYTDKETADTVYSRLSSHAGEIKRGKHESVGVVLSELENEAGKEFVITISIKRRYTNSTLRRLGME